VYIACYMASPLPSPVSPASPSFSNTDEAHAKQRARLQRRIAARAKARREKESAALPTQAASPNVAMTMKAAAVTEADIAALESVRFPIPRDFCRWTRVFPGVGATLAHDGSRTSRFYRHPVLTSHPGLVAPVRGQLVALCRVDPTGIRIYDAAVLLAAVLTARITSPMNPFTRTTSVCELGAGMGFVSLELARAIGPDKVRVLATDLESVMLEIISVNHMLQRQSPSGSTTAMETKIAEGSSLPPNRNLETQLLPWGDVSAADQALAWNGGHKFDVLAAADVLYGGIECIGPLLSTVDRLSGPYTQCVVCWQRRPMHEDVAEAFLAEAMRLGFRIDNVAPPEEFRNAAEGSLRVVALTRPALTKR
jgi:hypothetical protein